MGSGDVIDTEVKDAIMRKQWTIKLDGALIGIHTVLYGLGVLGLLSFAQSPFGVPGGYVFLMMLWTFGYVLHNRHFAFARGAAQAVSDERSAYRQGYADGVEDTERHGSLKHKHLLDDGEMVVDDYAPLEWDEEKRKRR